jgi:hypothetical protein
MSTQPNNGILVGTWTYRSFQNDPNLAASFNSIKFGSGNIRIDPSPMNEFKGKIFDVGWELALKGSTTYGNPFTVRFQGKGVVGDEEWIYDYEGYVIRPWPNGVNQRMAIVGTIVRTIPHSGGAATAGVVCSWIAVRQDDPPS